MPAKSKTVFICNQCGYESAKWYGQCPSCGQWNCMEESAAVAVSAKKHADFRGRSRAVTIDEISETSEIRYDTGISELNRALGGGLVKGSLVLIGGDPGIGKSTILLQACKHLSESKKVLYVSGEESASQIKLRAGRLGVSSKNLYVLCETDAEYIAELIRSEKPDVVIIDSIQTMSITDIQSTTGSVTQVRECTNLFMRTAKTLGIPIFIVGHVNKDGNIAGPKVLEHIVDTVLYFEGDRNMSYRILRAVKNRFGSTNEIGVFTMNDTGLEEVPNPSQMLLDGRPKNTSGTCVMCVMEGSRPILAEVQALVTPINFGNPRRMTNGYDFNRMAMLIAVLEKRAGYYFANTDCYLNMVGGLKIDEPASDLAVVLALVSSLKDMILKDDVIAFGEIGLAGEIRGVSNALQRVNEAVRMGFRKIIIPFHNYKSLPEDVKNKAEIVGVRRIRDAFTEIVL
ncbi:MAG: DNA repair protein RadA [Clostridiales bacterium]|nr:DNA repair protein RadA [Clostridiales bacterium]MCD7827430.1 DNA repair protein RadA [Clostridiales bacterium]